jgi:hypothetical protein
MTGLDDWEENRDRAMLSKVPIANLGAAFIISALAFPSAGASAATVLPPADSAFAEGEVLEVSVIDAVKKKQDPSTIWNPMRDGERCVYRTGSCRHFYRDYYYETPWWGLPWATGGEAASNEFDPHGQPVRS